MPEGLAKCSVTTHSEGRGALVLRAAILVIFLVFGRVPEALAGEIWSWGETPIHRTIVAGTNTVLDLRELGWGDEGGDAFQFAIALAPEAYRISGYTETLPSFVSNSPSSSGNLIITNPTIGVYSFTMRGRHKTNPGPLASGRVGVRLTIIAPNYPPVAVNDSYTQAHSTTVDYDVLSNDSDANGDALLLTSENSPYASIVSNRLRFSAPPTPGTYVVTYTISDGNGGAAVATATITVPNVAPLAVNDSYSQTHSTTVDHDVLSNDSDPNGDALTLTSEDSPYASVVSNRLRFAAPAVPGTYTVTYGISDGRGGTATATATITVPNAAPVAVGDSYSQTHSTTVDHDVLSNDSDPNGDALTLVSENSSYASIVSNRLRFAAPATPGVYLVTYTVSDGRGGTASAVATITVPNVAPTAVNDSYTQARSTTVDHNVLANDSDPNGDVLSITSQNSPYASIVSNRLRFAAPALPGVYPVTYTVSDGRGGTASAVATITVPNAAPVAVNDSATTVTGSPVVVAVTANDSDSDGQIATVTILSGPASGSAFVNPDQSVTYTSDPDFSGTDSFTYRITDNHGATSGTATVTVTVNPKPVSRAVYQYDALGRLTVIQYSTGLGGVTGNWLEYCYDPNGNRVSMEAGTGLAGAACQ